MNYQAMAEKAAELFARSQLIDPKPVRLVGFCLASDDIELQLCAWIGKDLELDDYFLIPGLTTEEQRKMLKMVFPSNPACIDNAMDLVVQLNDSEDFSDARCVLHLFCYMTEYTIPFSASLLVSAQVESLEKGKPERDVDLADCPLAVAVIVYDQAYTIGRLVGDDERERHLMFKDIFISDHILEIWNAGQEE